MRKPAVSCHLQLNGSLNLFHTIDKMARHLKPTHIQYISVVNKASEGAGNSKMLSTFFEPDVCSWDNAVSIVNRRRDAQLRALISISPAKAGSGVRLAFYSVGKRG
jgi:hypothetical protein